MFSIDEGHWSSFKESNARKSRIEADKISYAWDSIIEKFNYHAINGSLYFEPEEGIKGHEIAMRFAAAEPRTRRRYLSESIFGLLKKYPPDKRATRILSDKDGEFPTYVVLLLPPLPEVEYEIYREGRRDFLSICCQCVPLVHRNATDIVGLATETNCVSPEQRSEDFMYYDARDLSEEQIEHAKTLQAKWDLFTNLEGFKTKTVGKRLTEPVLYSEPSRSERKGESAKFSFQSRGVRR